MMTDITDKTQDLLVDDCVPHFDLQVEELDDVALSLDEEGDGQLYERLSMCSILPVTAFRKRLMPVLSMSMANLSRVTIRCVQAMSLL